MKKPWQKERSTGGEAAVQLRGGGRNAFGRLSGYVPLLDGETALYREVREAVPVVDAAICKLIRLTGGVRVMCSDEPQPFAFVHLKFHKGTSLARNEFPIDD